MSALWFHCFSGIAGDMALAQGARVAGRAEHRVGCPSMASMRIPCALVVAVEDQLSKELGLAPGEVLLDYAQQMLNLRHSAQTALVEMRNLHNGKVTISANEHTVFFLLPVIAEFRRLHPNIKIEVQRGVAARGQLEASAVRRAT